MGSHSAELGLSASGEVRSVWAGTSTALLHPFHRAAGARVFETPSDRSLLPARGRGR
jgi:hypothetical protein